MKNEPSLCGLYQYRLHIATDVIWDFVFYLNRCCHDKVLDEGSFLSACACTYHVLLKHNKHQSKPAHDTLWLYKTTQSLLAVSGPEIVFSKTCWILRPVWNFVGVVFVVKYQWICVTVSPPLVVADLARFKWTSGEVKVTSHAVFLPKITSCIYDFSSFLPSAFWYPLTLQSYLKDVLEHRRHHASRLANLCFSAKSKVW